MAGYINQDILNSYCGPGDDSLVRDLFGYFKARVPARFEMAKSILQENDNKGFKAQMHSLKNSFLNVGALGVAEDCQRLEDISHILTLEETLRELNLIFEKFKEVEAELSQMLGGNV